MHMKKGVDFTGVAIVFACHDGKGNFLFAKRGVGSRDGHGAWEMPAGGLKFGERIEDGLLRELKEELCVSPVKVLYIGHKEVIDRDGDFVKKHWVNFEYLVEVDPSAVQIGEPDKCEEIIWRTLDNIPSPLHFGVAETIAQVKAYLNR